MDRFKKSYISKADRLTPNFHRAVILASHHISTSANSNFIPVPSSRKLSKQSKVRELTLVPGISANSHEEKFWNSGSQKTIASVMK